MVGLDPVYVLQRRQQWRGIDSGFREERTFSESGGTV